MDVAFFLSLVHSLGYLGVFLSSLIGSATIILPVPSFAFVVAAGAVLNPFAVGILAGAGAALGEMTGYGLGYGIHRARKRITKKGVSKKWAGILKRWFHKKLGIVIIVLFAATPMPDDIIGIFCGLVRYDIRKFFVAMLIGKTLLGLALAYAGFYGVDFIADIFA